MTARTFGNRHVFFFYTNTLVFAPCLCIAALHVCNYAWPRSFIFAVPFAALLFINPVNILFQVSVPEIVILFFRKLVQRRIKRKTAFLCDCFKQRMIPFTFRIIECYSAFVKTFPWIRNYFFQIPFHFLAKSGTFWTGTKRIIKGEKTRLKFRNRNTAVRTCIFLAKKNFFFTIFCFFSNDDNARSTFQRSFYRICKALAAVWIQDYAVYNDFDCMLFLLVQLYVFIKAGHDSVYASPYKTRLKRVL